MNAIQIGAAVRRLREMRNLTLRAVAEQAGFSASFLSQVENEQASPSISSMERIAAALGVTLGEFFQTFEQNPARVIRADSRQTLYSGWSNTRLEFPRRRRVQPAPADSDHPEARRHQRQTSRPGPTRRVCVRLQWLGGVDDTGR